LQRWNDLIEFFSNENTKEANELVKSFSKTDNKIYQQFLRIFLGEVNHVHTVSEKRETLAHSIEEQIDNFLNQMINLILIDGLRKISIEAKLNFYKQKEKENAMQVEKSIKSPKDSELHGNKINNEQNLYKKDPASVVQIDDTITKEPQKFVEHLLSVYKSKIEWDLIKDSKKRGRNS